MPRWNSSSKRTLHVLQCFGTKKVKCMVIEERQRTIPGQTGHCVQIQSLCPCKHLVLVFILVSASILRMQSNRPSNSPWISAGLMLSLFTARWVVFAARFFSLFRRRFLLSLFAVSWKGINESETDDFFFSLKRSQRWCFKSRLLARNLRRRRLRGDLL